MAITYDDKAGVFLLSTPSSTYVMRLHNGKRGRTLLHCGWFQRLDTWGGVCDAPLLPRSFAPEPDGENSEENFSLSVVRQEWPAPGGTDFRASAFEVRTEGIILNPPVRTKTGHMITTQSTGLGQNSAELFYRSHRVYKGKKPLTGLPATYVESDSEADTLEIDLTDPATGLVVTLVYTVWNDRDVICRHAVYRNEGAKPVTLLGTMSASVDFDGGVDSGMRLLTMSGAHARERHPYIRPLVPGMQGVSSRRGMSSHQQNPFMALLSSRATETTGEVFGMSFVYSGEFDARVEVDQFGTARAQMGIGRHNFKWVLAHGGDVFTAPEVVMVRSEEGLGGMSRIYHDLYRTRLARGKWRDLERPIVINNWEATYFDFDEEKLLALARTAAAEGVECFVLDDGWYGDRCDDRRALGDWQVNTKKLPSGLGGLADDIHKTGLMFGLWVEPEMVSHNSDLYRAHPDWCIHIDGRPQSCSRHQLVLDLSRADVVDYLIETFTAVLSSAKIDYIKWDFNRSPAWMSPEQPYNYYLGLYRLMEALTSKFPDVLFESCSGGGGRFDPGMLYYMPQTWTSDNTDAFSRITIQGGTSIVYPASMMSCHVSAVPNHQTGRLTPLQVRGAVAMAGTFGYELDLNKLTPTELQEIKTQIVWYKGIRSTVQFGDLYRLRPVWGAGCSAALTMPEAQSIVGYSAWEHAARDKSQAVVTVVWTMAEANAPSITLRLCGLDPKRTYRFTSLTSATTQEMLGSSVFEVPNADSVVARDGTEATGAELMYAGIVIVCRPQQGGSLQWRLDAV